MDIYILDIYKKFLKIFFQNEYKKVQECFSEIFALAKI